MAVGSAAGGAHDGDDLFDLRPVGRVAQTLVARRLTGMEPRQRRRRPPSTGTIEQTSDMTPPRTRGTSPTIGPTPTGPISLPTPSSGQRRPAIAIGAASRQQRGGVTR